MDAPGWKAVGPLRSREQTGWISDLEPLTTGMLAQDSLKLWIAGHRAAVGIRSSTVVYPVFPGTWDPGWEPGARAILERIGDSWCMMGPGSWVARAEALMPESRILHRVPYEFLSLSPGTAPRILSGPGKPRLARPKDSEVLFSLQESYEKEEVLFDPRDFQALASRIHFSLSLRDQVIEALWVDGVPVAKAGTNALTDRWAQLGGVFTRPGYRGQGYQKRLLADLLARLADQGRGACLFVKTANLPALGLYRSLGFSPLGNFTIIYGERRS